MSASPGVERAAPSARVEALFAQRLERLHVGTDRTFAALLLFQFVSGILAALVISPRTWAGTVSGVHPHVGLALGLGGAITILPLYLVWKRPGQVLTRQTIAVCQALWSALLIHLTGGRIETHFHVFGSLAFLAFYRDVRVLLMASLVIAADHVLRGAFLPRSVFGTLTPSDWRWLEHAGWVVFEDIMLVASCVRGRRELLEMSHKQAELERVAETVEHKVVERTRELEATRRYMVAVYQAVPGALLVLDRGGRIREMNAGAAEMLGYSPDELIGCRLDSLLCGGDSPRPRASGGAGEQARRECRLRTRSGAELPVLFSAGQLEAEDGVSTELVCVALDLREQKKLELQARQSQKLESLGQLAAGIAHEINTPTQFVGDNLRFVQGSLDELMPVLRSCASLRTQAGQGPSAPAVEEILATSAAVDAEFLAQELPQALQDALGGVERIAGIVRAMKEFSHPGGSSKQPADVNHLVTSTVTVARNEWKYVAEVDLRLDPRLPRVPCYPQDLNQVVLNMVVNAAHAIQERRARTGVSALGKITIETGLRGGELALRIADDGCGIPAALRERVYDPFFTTKEVGKGTGQGLAIAHHVVVEKHGGRIELESEVGVGTTFTVLLPLAEAGAGVAPGN